MVARALTFFFIVLVVSACKKPTEPAKTVSEVIEQYGMSELMDGIYLAIDYRSADTLRSEQLDPKYGEDHVYVSSIYYLITPKAKDSFHTLKSDEIWHWYEGDPVQLTVINLKGEVEEIVLGQGKYQHTVQAGSWYFATQMGETYSLVGLVVVPGFEDSDFTPAKRAELLELYPQYQQLIKANTPE